MSLLNAPAVNFLLLLGQASRGPLLVARDRSRSCRIVGEESGVVVVGKPLKIFEKFEALAPGRDELFDFANHC